MARLVDRNTGEQCAECADLKQPPQLAVKVVAAGSRRMPLCEKHLQELLDDCAAYVVSES